MVVVQQGYDSGGGADTLLLKKIGQKCEIGEEDGGGGVAAFKIGRGVEEGVREVSEGEEREKKCKYINTV